MYCRQWLQVSKVTVLTYFWDNSEYTNREWRILWVHKIRCTVRVFSCSWRGREVLQWYFISPIPRKVSFLFMILSSLLFSLIRSSSLTPSKVLPSYILRVFFFVLGSNLSLPVPHPPLWFECSFNEVLLSRGLRFDYPTWVNPFWVFQVSSRLTWRYSKFDICHWSLFWKGPSH